MSYNPQPIDETDVETPQDMPVDLKELARVIATKRDSLDLSQSDLARRTGLTPQYINKLEKPDNRTQPSQKTVDKISRALGMPLADLRALAGYAAPAQSVDVLARGGLDELCAQAAELTPEHLALVVDFVKLLRARQETADAPPVIAPELDAAELPKRTQEGEGETKDS